MDRAAYVVAARWPFDELTLVGRLTRPFVGSGWDHIGLRIDNCAPFEVEAHSHPSVSLPNARGERNVCFDFVSSNSAVFHCPKRGDFFTARCETRTFRVLASASEVHRLCLLAARQRPKNGFWLRLNAALGGWLPFHTCPPRASPALGPSTCAALTLRIVVAASTGDSAAMVDDAAALRGAGSPPCRFVTTSMTPGEALEALLREGLVEEVSLPASPAPSLLLRL